MTTLRIKLSDELRAAADEQISSGQYPDHSAYISNLIRDDIERRQTEHVLLGRLRAGPATEMTDADFERIRMRLDERAAFPIT